MKRLALLVAPLALAACATVPPASDSGTTYARFGQTVSVDGPSVTPLELLEDSRCPADVQCVWAGQVRITARVSAGGGTTRLVELTSGKPAAVADGSLTLSDVQPGKRSTAAIAKADYRLGFTFAGGL